MDLTLGVTAATEACNVSELAINILGDTDAARTLQRSALQHRSLELVLLRTGDGHNPLHPGLVELVLRHVLKLDLLDLLLESA